MKRVNALEKKENKLPGVGKKIRLKGTLIRVVKRVDSRKKKSVSLCAGTTATRERKKVKILRMIKRVNSPEKKERKKVCCQVWEEKNLC